MEAKLLSLWNALDGWKSILGVALWVVYGVLVSVGWLEPNDALLRTIQGIVGVGLLDKVQKFINAVGSK